MFLDSARYHTWHTVIMNKCNCYTVVTELNFPQLEDSIHTYKVHYMAISINNTVMH